MKPQNHQARPFAEQPLEREPHPPSNTEKDPDDWISGDEPMTGAQTSYLKTLSQQAYEPDAFSDRLTKAEASKRIDALNALIALYFNLRPQVPAPKSVVWFMVALLTENRAIRRVA